MSTHYYSKRIPQRTAVRRPRSRPRTFNTQAAAQAHAENCGIKNAVITSAKKDRFMIKEE